MSSKIIYYYQTFSGLTMDKLQGITHIHLASVHFGKNSAEGEYIHLNDYSPYDSKFDQVWQELEEASKSGIKIVLMVGGAGGAFGDYQTNPRYYYSLLKKLIVSKKKIISGVDLDIEESMNYSLLKELIVNLKNDFGSDFIISLAPVSYALENDIPGMGGFIYKQLEEEIGILINYYNTQFYYDYDWKNYNKVVANDYKPQKIIFGAIDNIPIESQIDNVTNLKKKYGNSFGGVYIWEYCNAPKNWNNLMYNIIE